MASTPDSYPAVSLDSRRTSPMASPALGGAWRRPPRSFVRLDDRLALVADKKGFPVIVPGGRPAERRGVRGSPDGLP